MTLFYRFSLTNSSKTADHFTMDTILGGALLTRTIVGTNVITMWMKSGQQ